MKRPSFISGNIYHIYNRGVDKRTVFLDDEDRFRFVHGLWEFNDRNPALNIYYKVAAIDQSMNPAQTASGIASAEKERRRPRDLLIKIHSFCLMDNHFHLLVEPIDDASLSIFMQKLGTGYTNYFNNKYERSGALFQGKFKAVAITNDAHFVHIPYYIHCNPLDFKFYKWRKKEIENPREALKFLENYRWSSFQDYIGKRNFPSVTHRGFLNKFIGSENWRQDMLIWLKGNNIDEIEEDLLLKKQAK
jgi:putative transposase